MRSKATCIIFLIVFLFSIQRMMSQRSLIDFEKYMHGQLPKDWKQVKTSDSSFLYIKKGMAQYDLDPPQDTPAVYGFKDSLTVFLQFFKPREKWQVRRDDSIAVLLKNEIENLNKVRRDSIYRGKRGFYRWVYDYRNLHIKYRVQDYITIPGYEITLSNSEGYFPLTRFLDETIYDEEKMIRAKIIAYLKEE